MDEQYLKYEQIVKALSELIINYTINTIEYTKIINTVPNLKLISRGGDALNYYFDDFTPTHDWDLGLITIDLKTNLNQDDYNKRIEIVNSLMLIFSFNLNTFFETYVINDNFKNIKFYNEWGGSPRLKHLIYDYVYDDISYSNSLIDIYIYDNVDENVTNDDYNIKKNNFRFVQNIPHWKEKINENDTRNIEQIINSMNDKIPITEINYSLNQNNKGANNLKEFLIFNKINIVVKDTISNMYYMAPGDLFNDTMRMVYQSLYNIDIYNNKLDKYLKKLSKLINLLNTLNICVKNTCKFDVNLKVLSCDVNNFDCEGNSLINVYKWKNSFLNYLKKEKFIKNINSEYYHSLLSYLSVKKICEIIHVLKLYDEIFTDNKSSETKEMDISSNDSDIEMYNL